MILIVNILLLIMFPQIILKLIHSKNINKLKILKNSNMLTNFFFIFLSLFFKKAIMQLVSINYFKLS